MKIRKKVVYFSDTNFKKKHLKRGIEVGDPGKKRAYYSS